jgi:ankyrin repeat protein
MIEQAVVDECVGSAHGDLDRVRQLVELHPGIVNARASWNETPVEAATQLGRRDIIEYLLDRGAPLDIFTACVLGRADVVADELARDPSLAVARGVHELPPLYFAAIGAQPAIAKLLLAAGAEVSQATPAAAPLHGAVMGRSAEMVRWLLDHGADASVPDHEGRTARQLAEAMQQPDLAALFA